ncbi:N5-carboxyaminoimidazole ribonucleotide synthase [Roseibium aquae]|uniref:N5-carboxyaminoimidazole ribonucleotide synthase n=1 Tax=Roseibium aquae TaxID=1323746 RepID=A0A916T766_9HYPH|nr:5-(carboxyamino)imidazole ribonucleotide synthase [Roseibium aquae]GGB32543.1 N5-carboxyaminoimidazole ribonucleotide synthase [Roseibium aquae]
MPLRASLRPGDTIGILGGGQLGRMLALAAAPLGLKTHIFCPDPQSPAFEVADAHTIADYEDQGALERFAETCDAVTYEFENVPAGTAAFLENRVVLRPGARALEISQDRLTEKQFLEAAGADVAPYRDIANEGDLFAALAAFGGQGVLKTRRFGYDGKGQVMIRAAEDTDTALERIGNAPAVLEALIPFDREMSVIVARDAAGTCGAFDVSENLHRNHILHTSTVPAGIGPALAETARAMAIRIAEAMDYVGVMGVELFVVPSPVGETVLVNEIAPRVHNSGHWTQDACLCDQFEQHIRAVAGWPLGTFERHSDAVMTNLIGDACDSWPDILRDPSARLHLYGKTESRPGRKMGHWNRITPHQAGNGSSGQKS